MKKIILLSAICAIFPVAKCQVSSLTSIGMQDNARFNVTNANVPNLTFSPFSMPQYGIAAPNTGGSADFWISGLNAIRMFTNNNASPQFNIVNGNVGIGTIDPQNKLTVYGTHTTTSFLLHSDNGTNSSADLVLWASEPAMSYTGVGIGNNIKNYSNSISMNRIDASRGGSYIRLLDNEINFNLVSNTGAKRTSLTLYANGNGALQGKLEAKEIKVTTAPTADFVFAENYKLPTLDEVEKHIKEKQHLPEIASAKEMEKEGVNVGEFQIKLLQKIEELTLYQIELNKKILSLEKEIKSIKKIK